ncbi:dTDP-4-dehydrorhamnose 3,5-epimerase [Geomicrobium halophilum]|uniref:dTDP-4-dehydrorhamnose 3,5-epimerase n=1 Tax=Geomicrobium halophilum TaxID=549000 RepID=A0A841PLU1_9BACL|nr:dTDP-4-dehydrorhamnose 3,5-epimerase [Geomicrobium halophilum]MBB6449719.1 dTDP-4-dehydrorhamnose 3,5-epimerase [Geomicrobium halophilum]
MNKNSHLGIPGVYWEKNFFAETGENSYTLVANKGPLVTDLFHYKENSYKSYALSVGQINRYTFFGKSDQVISAKLVDCRSSSENLHKKIEFNFKPDPTQCLVVERGIAEYFEGLDNISVRSEPILFSTNKPNGHDLGDDSIAIPLDKLDNEFPIISPSELPLPNEALQFMLKREQEVIKSGKNVKSTSNLYLNNKFYKISLQPKPLY